MSRKSKERRRVRRQALAQCPLCMAKADHWHPPARFGEPLPKRPRPVG